MLAVLPMKLIDNVEETGTDMVQLIDDTSRDLNFPSPQQLCAIHQLIIKTVEKL